MYLDATPRFVGNHSNDKRQIVEQAIKESGLSLFISEYVVDSSGYLIKDDFSVWSNEPRGTDMGPFGKAYRRLVKQQDGNA